MPDTPVRHAELVAKARHAVDALRDAARLAGDHVMPFRERDKHVVALHDAIDALDRPVPEPARERLREAIRYWSYCTWQGLQKECPEKAPEFLELCRSLDIQPYANSTLSQPPPPTITAGQLAAFEDAPYPGNETTDVYHEMKRKTELASPPPTIAAEPATDDQTYAMFVRHVRAVAEPFLTEMYGERCPDFCAGCECCERWKALDRLTCDPGAALDESPVADAITADDLAASAAECERLLREDQSELDISGRWGWITDVCRVIEFRIVPALRASAAALHRVGELEAGLERIEQYAQMGIDNDEAVKCDASDHIRVRERARSLLAPPPQPGGSAADAGSGDG